MNIYKVYIISDYEYFCISLTAIASVREKTTFDWIVSSQCDLKNSNIFLIQLIDDDTHKQTTTGDFNITETGTATEITASATSSFTDMPPTPSATALSNSGLSQETKVGVGAGVGLGGAFLIALVAIVWYFRRRTKNAGAGGGSDVAPAYALVDNNMSSRKQESIPQQPQKSTPAELPDDRGVNAELPGDRGVEVSAEPAPVRHELP